MKVTNLIYLFLILVMTSCYDLNKMPEGVLSTEGAFSSTSEIRNYLDQFYESGLRAQAFPVGGGSGIAGGDSRSDNMSSNAVDVRLVGQLALSSAQKLTNYNQIRNLNFLLNNLDNSKEKGTELFNHYVGEAYYFRAWYYYKMFINYGKLAWVDTPLAPNLEDMKFPRENRTVIADHILDDLDKSIELLMEKNNSSSMRIHKDVARTLKSEVALFEGTWEKYHKLKNTPFFDPTITDEKIKSYLTQAAKAAKEVIDRGVWKIYNTGNVRNDYRQLFQITDLSTNPEIIWFKMYDGDQVGNDVNRYLNRGGGMIGVTSSLVDDYLTIEGKPFVGSDVLEAKKNFGDELSPELRDPRLSQTVCMPGQQLRPDEPEGYILPPLVSSAYHTNPTGYSLLKHVQIDYTGNLDAEGKGATPGIQFRYADVLLNYAEALAELDGASNAKEIIKTLKPLRDRVGMPAMDFDREYNQDISYPFRNLDKYIQAVRRERRVETACEDRRFNDIIRWAAADELIVGKWPQGVLFTGSNLENNPFYGGKLIYDKPNGNNIYLTGNPSDTYRYILPVNPKGYDGGWQFNTKRDYLLPIQERMIELTEGLWEQNPGW